MILELRSARCMLMQAMVLINVHTVDEKTNRRQHLIYERYRNVCVDMQQRKKILVTEGSNSLSFIYC